MDFCPEPNSGQDGARGWFRRRILRWAGAPAALCLFAAGAWSLQTTPERQLQDADARVRERAARAIGEQGNPAYVPTLAPLVQDSDERVRTTVVRALIRLGSPASLPPLTLAVRDGIPEIRFLAIDGIVNFYLPGYVDTGFGGFFRSVSRRVIRHSSTSPSPSGAVTRSTTWYGACVS